MVPASIQRGVNAAWFVLLVWLSYGFVLLSGRSHSCVWFGSYNGGLLRVVMLIMRKAVNVLLFSYSIVTDVAVGVKVNLFISVMCGVGCGESLDFPI